MYFDLHNHSNFSRDGHDSLEDIVLNAIQSGLDCVGITDHNYWVSGEFDAHLQRINELKSKYADKICVLAGMEISFLIPDGFEPDMLREYDYCLLESFIEADVDFESLCKLVQRLPCPVGLAHTDLFWYRFAHCKNVLELMKENCIFWELNVSYDRVHAYREHRYVGDFMRNKEQRELIRSHGIELSVGYDTHILLDYDARRVKDVCDFIEENSFKIPSFVK